MNARYGLLAAFLLVNAVWGTTFMAIRVGVADLPPALFGGVRFLLAGLVMLVVSRLLGQPLPRTRYDWNVVVVTAVLMIVGGNGLLTWAEQWLPSNQAALLVTASALWLALFGTLGPKGVPLTLRVSLGIGIGLIGTALMFWRDDAYTSELVWAQLAALGSSLSWAIAAIILRNATMQTRDVPFAAAQMVVGGGIMCILGIAIGELPRWQMTPAASGSLWYLTIMGSCVAYSAYLWMVPRAKPATLGMVSYMVPVVATIAGWWWLHEKLTSLQWFGMAVIVAGVAIVTWPTRRASSG
ncbi:MAG: EamA family transporter [Gammaproteobacteria bacterium]